MREQEMGKTFKSAYEASLERSTALGVNRDLLIQAKEQEIQSRAAAFFPKLTASVGLLTQALPSNPTGTLISPQNQTTIKLGVIQPLFRGLSEYAAIRQKRSTTDERAHTIHQAARQLFYDVAQAYYTVQMTSVELKNHEIEIELNKKREEELNRFLRIGRAQLSDVLTLQANILGLESQLESTKGRHEIAKDVLAYLTGWDRNTVLSDEETPESQLGELSDYLEAMNRRPEIAAAQAALESAEETIAIKRGGHFPSVDLIGNYYLERPGLALKSVNWDLQLAVSFPIFQGGLVSAQIREAQALTHQWSLNLAESRRKAEQEIRTFYQAFNSDRRQMQKLTQLVQVSRKNYEVQSRVFKNGLVTNLDVLQSLTTYQASKRQLDQIQCISVLDSLKLQAAVGRREEIPTQ